MKVILLQDVLKVGKRFEVREVAAGYARNFLLKNNLAREATEEALSWLEAQKEILESRAEEGLKKSQEVASQLDDLEVVVPVKVGDNGQLFESVTAQKISDQLREMGFAVKKNQIELNDPIREIGEYPVKLKFEHNLEAEIRVIVQAEA
ncbi:MAG: 50S ribosomal protein L9 [Candidatus Pacearchaeota archaeon]|nr:50S ribosomal protein L9 [Candidatus Pacearchaeota archaeon]